MEILKKLGDFLLSGIPFFVAFLAGRASKEKAILKEENEKLKEYKKIDDREVQKNEVYDHNRW